jgi:hypothetical protein
MISLIDSQMQNSRHVQHVSSGVVAVWHLINDEALPPHGWKAPEKVDGQS